MTTEATTTTEPTWENQLREADKLSNKELKRHAAVSTENRHLCQDCFCCAALHVLTERKNMTMGELRRAHETYFSRRNRQFFQDSGYRLLTAKSGKRYMVRMSAAWSDMLGGAKRYRYFLNPIGVNLEIEPLLDGKDGGPRDFADLDAVKDWLREL